MYHVCAYVCMYVLSFSNRKYRIGSEKAQSEAGSVKRSSLSNVLQSRSGVRLEPTSTFAVYYTKGDFKDRLDKFWKHLLFRSHISGFLTILYSFNLLVKLVRYSLVFSARQHICYSALYAIARPSVRPSVCPSVCPSHGWISQRRLK